MIVRRVECFENLLYNEAHREFLGFADGTEADEWRIPGPLPNDITHQMRQR